MNRCETCRHWQNLVQVSTKVKESQHGECGSPKIWGWYFLDSLVKLDKKKELKDADCIVITEEYFQTPKKLQNTDIITGKNFGCVNWEEK